MLPLADAAGRDQVLASGLEALRYDLDDGAAGADRDLPADWLARRAGPFEAQAVPVPAAIDRAAGEFTARQVALARADAEVEKTRAEAELLRARAEFVRAEAEFVRAEARRRWWWSWWLRLWYPQYWHPTKRVEADGPAAEPPPPERTAADLLAELRRRGIVWATDGPDEVEDVLRVGVRKPGPAD